ncbi:hypothetical protein CKY02_00005, partial [Photorhabdus bodei]
LTGQCLTILKRFQGFVEIERLSHLSFLFEIYYWNDTEFLTLPGFAFVMNDHISYFSFSYHIFKVLINLKHNISLSMKIKQV